MREKRKKRKEKETLVELKPDYNYTCATVEFPWKVTIFSLDFASEKWDDKIFQQLVLTMPTLISEEKKSQQFLGMLLLVIYSLHRKYSTSLNQGPQSHLGII